MAGHSFKVGTYNLSNLLAAQGPAGQVKSPRQLELLARNIDRSGVDILAVEEVQNEGLLRSFLESHLPGQFPHVALVPGQ